MARSYSLVLFIYLTRSNLTGLSNDLARSICMVLSKTLARSEFVVLSTETARSYASVLSLILATLAPQSYARVRDAGSDREEAPGVHNDARNTSRGSATGRA